MKLPALVLSVLLLGAAFLSGDEQTSVIAPNPAFERLKTLAGSWAGTAVDGDKTFPATVRFKIISDGSAIASWLGEDTPHEMVTMFHPDGSDIVATHYCSAHNQPRMFLLPGNDPNRLVFKFKDGTNIHPGDGYMEQLAVVFDTPDHHVEEWTYRDKGSVMPASRFDFRRKP